MQRNRIFVAGSYRFSFVSVKVLVLFHDFLRRWNYISCHCQAGPAQQTSQLLAAGTAANPCRGPPETSVYWPTITPSGLMPKTMVAKAPGKSMLIGAGNPPSGVAGSCRKPWRFGPGSAAPRYVPTNCCLGSMSQIAGKVSGEGWLYGS